MKDLEIMSVLSVQVLLIRKIIVQYFEASGIRAPPEFISSYGHEVRKLILTQNHECGFIKY